MFARVIGVIGRIMVALGVFLLGFVGYQLWGTGLQESGAQDALAAQLVPAGTDLDPSTVDVDELVEQLAATDPATAPPLASPPIGQPVGFIEAPRIDLTRVVVEGVSKEELKQGPGHYPSTPLPGQAGNSGIAGHRTTYGAPFNRIDELAVGDEVVLTTPQGRFVYRVLPGLVAGQAWYTVDPSDVSVLRDFGDTRITLTACHPKYSAQLRIIVHARLETPAAASVPVSDADDTAPAANPDEGQASDADLGGDQSALLPAIGWGVAALLLISSGWVLGQLWRKPPAYLLFTPLTLGAVWMCYVYLDRYIPAL
ncbi:MAG: class E sortase [Actinobacteria bacterium]|nr:class E sortase [Actinomycetota bacterium]